MVVRLSTDLVLDILRPWTESDGKASSDDKGGNTATCTSRKKAPALHKDVAALRDMNGIMCLYITS